MSGEPGERKYPSDFKRPWNSDADAYEDYKRSINGGYTHWYDSKDDKKNFSSSSDCFVATAIGFEPKLMQRFYCVRDNVLTQSFIGKLFIYIYYAGLGKVLAKTIITFEFLQDYSREILLILLNKLEKD